MKQYLKLLVVYKLDGRTEVLLVIVTQIGVMDAATVQAPGHMMDGAGIDGIQWPRNGGVGGGRAM